MRELTKKRRENRDERKNEKENRRVTREKKRSQIKNKRTAHRKHTAREIQLPYGRRNAFTNTNTDFDVAMSADAATDAVSA